jgi:cysteine desulfurase
MNVYFDNNATTPVLDGVKKEVSRVMDIFANPSSLHGMGTDARSIIDLSRKTLSGSIGCEPEEIIFTSGGTESNNIAIQGFLKTSKKKHIITSKIEHHAVLNVFQYLSKNGYEVSWMAPDEDGIISAESVRHTLRPDTAFVSIMTANNEIGTIQPISEISKVIKEYSKEIVFHTDAVQALGKIDFDVKKMGVDMLSVSAHKINGPKGIGALYIRKGLKIKPVYFGGKHERSLRPGTENTHGIAGFGKAVESGFSGLDEKYEYVKKLRDLLRDGIEKSISNIKINGHREKVLPNTLNVSFRNVEGESIMMMLDMEGICVSTGSACSSGSLEPSHVLTSMGLDPADAQGSIRFSLGHFNTTEEVEYVLEKLPPVIERLRKMSPLER